MITAVSLKRQSVPMVLPLPDISQSVADNGDIWIADINSGLVKGENMDEFSVLNLPGPVSNNAFHISSLQWKNNNMRRRY